MLLGPYLFTSVIDPSSPSLNITLHTRNFLCFPSSDMCDTFLLFPHPPTAQHPPARLRQLVTRFTPGTAPIYPAAFPQLRQPSRTRDKVTQPTLFFIFAKSLCKELRNLARGKQLQYCNLRDLNPIISHIIRLQYRTPWGSI
jgi:hypothetical protein